MDYRVRAIPLGLSLFLTSCLAHAEDSGRRETFPDRTASAPLRPEQVAIRSDSGSDIMKVNVTLKMETFFLRNKKLRSGDKREHVQEREPQARLRLSLLEGRPLYGVAEMELKDKTKRTSGNPKQNKTHLELTQVYFGMDADALNTRLLLGRWLYRDEREWLLDENIDGALAYWRFGKWRADLLGGRVNYWQRDLLDRTSRDSGATAAAGAIVRRKFGKDWFAGAYLLTTKNTHNDDSQRLHYGLRSHGEQNKGLRHWGELGAMQSDSTGSQRHGFAVDAGATYIFSTPLRPRVTLGYAMASKYYRQTGLQSNEATMGGNTKFNIYGATLAPELTNLHILTAGIGVNITPDSTLDLVYHDYRQVEKGDLDVHNSELKSRYDTRKTSRLGGGIDLIWGLEVNEHLKTELIMGMFTPSKRFRSGSGDNASRSAPAYSVGFEAEYRF